MIAQQNSLPIRASPYKHQQDAAAFALKHLKAGGGAALLMEMGTGKTITSIAVVGQLRNEGLIQRLLVICPVSVMGVWRDEFAKFAAYDYSLALLEGTTTKRADVIRHMKGRALQVLVLNYESVWRLEKELAAWQPDMIVCDEGHKIKNHQARASKALHRLSALARYRLLLTGTLITNKPLDVFSQYKFTDISVFGKSFYEFRSHFFDMVGFGGYTPVLKKSREAELTERIHSIAYRITKAECLDLPPYTDVVQKVDLEPSAQRLYRQLIRDCYAELAGGTVTVTNVLAQLTRLAQLTGGFLKNDQGVYEQVSTAKMDALSELVDSAQEDGRKLVVITLHRPEIDAISRMLDQKGIRHAIVHGGITGEERTKQVAAFQNDSGVTVFLGQIAAAGTGLTLTAATTMIFYSLDYNMSNYEQTRGRIHRISQNRRTTYIHLAARNTVDEKVLKALNEKADLAKALVDDCRAGRNPFTE